MDTISMTPIGFVKSTRQKIEDDNWDNEKMHIELDANQFSEEALFGLEDFLS